MTPRPARQCDTSTSDVNLSFAMAGRLIDGLAARNFDAVVTTMTDDVVFRALLPGRVLELDGRARVRTTLDRWFGAARRWELIEAVVGDVGGRMHLRWRIRLTSPAVGSGVFLVEQQVYADAGADGRLRAVALLCSGFLAEGS